MALPQPDFNRMLVSMNDVARGAHNVYDQFCLIPNMPTLDQGNQLIRILTQIQNEQQVMRHDMQGFRGQMNELRVEMRNGFRNVNNRIDDL